MVKKQPPPKFAHNRVWIELEHPGADDALGDTRAKTASAMMKKLGIGFTGHELFFWFKRKRVYCVTIDEAGGYLECGDNGHWFNLDFLAK